AALLLAYSLLVPQTAARVVRVRCLRPARSRRAGGAGAEEKAGRVRQAGPPRSSGGTLAGARLS
ncbi:hypothetical protein, partial [Streptomyces sp. NPDC005568]|uniref:hypothetical protein n=1 Tax=Streptomyces sp. NPDC005568 TaxID=3156887 RepID=UPI00339EB14F